MFSILRKKSLLDRQIQVKNAASILECYLSCSIHIENTVYPW
jgi:hypothetical protein